MADRGHQSEKNRAFSPNAMRDQILGGKIECPTVEPIAVSGMQKAHQLIRPKAD